MLRRNPHPTQNDAGRPSLKLHSLNDLPKADSDEVLQVIEDSQEIEKVLVSDLKQNGVFGKSYVVKGKSRLWIVEEGAVALTFAWDELTDVDNRDFVGIGILEARTKDGRRVELARYSRTLSEAVQELTVEINQKLGRSDTEIEERKDEFVQISGPKQDAGTYRCPECGYPLRHQGEVCPRCAKRRSFVFRVLKYVKPHWPLVAFGAVLSIFVTAASLAPAELVRWLIDSAILAEGLEMSQRMQRLIIIVVIFLGLIGVRMVTQHFQIKITGVLGNNMVRALRIDTYRALQRLALSYYDQELTGRIMARVLGDTQLVQGFVVNSLQVALINVLMIVAISVRLFTSNPLLAAIALGPVPIVILISRYFSRRFKGVFRSVRRRYSSLSGAVAESVTGVRVVKSFAQEEQEFEAFESKNRSFFEAQLSAVNIRARFQPIVMFIMTLATIAVWLIGGQLVIREALTLGLLIQFITYMNQFYPPIQMLLQLTESYQQSSTAAERVFSIMSMPSELADHDRSVELQDPKGRVEIKNVSFSYQAGQRILKNISLTIEPGQMIGIVGQTGAGKSTLVSLICRFYDPTSGTITIDGVDLRDVKTQSLRSNIGMVLQDTFLFARTIKENIAYGAPGVTDKQIITAAKAANAHEFIMNLPDGYDNEVGERGVTLSGGEKQRISIARAILKDPAILILDEATSAVDSVTEASIQDAMDHLVKGRTTIAIAHRLSTLRNADRLIVVDNGEIIEEGTHQGLMAKNGTYADLVNKQANFAREMIS